MTTDYESGKQDCADGISAKVGASEEYNNGYSEQYMCEQIQDFLTQKQEATQWKTQNRLQH